MNTYSDKSMVYSKPSVSGYPLRTVLPAGIAGGILLIIYFLIIKALGLHMQIELRWINFLLITPFAIFVINKYIRTFSSRTYLKALIISAGTCITAFFILSVFMVFYLFADTTFMNLLYNEAYPQLQLNPLSVFLLLMFEGVVGGVIISFVTLQFFADRIRKTA